MLPFRSKTDHCIGDVVWEQCVSLTSQQLLMRERIPEGLGFCSSLLLFCTICSVTGEQQLRKACVLCLMRFIALL